MRISVQQHASVAATGRSRNDFSGSNAIRLVHGDILVAQLRPGQEIDAACYAHKGVGRDHAKWSPVCPATYQLLPEVTITAPITGDHAKVRH